MTLSLPQRPDMNTRPATKPVGHDQTLFRDPPSAALKIVVLAAVVSYAGIAVTHGEGCLSGSEACLLLSPAVLIYWAPAFAVAWMAFAAVVKVMSPRQRVLPSLELGSGGYESPYVRAKAQDGMSAAGAGLFCVGLQCLTRAIAVRAPTGAHATALAVDEFFRSRLGVALVLGVAFILARLLLRRMQRPDADALNELR
jgi:hypothetical protein